MAQIAEGVRLSVEGGSDAADEGVRVPSQTVLTRGVAATRCSAIRSVISVASVVNPPSDRPLTQAVLTRGGRGRPRSVAGGTDKRRSATTRPLTQTVLTRGVAATRCSAIRSVISVASMVNPPSDRPLTQAVLTVLRSPFSIITGRLTACGVAATTHPLTQTVLTGGVLQRGILQRGVLQRAVVYELSVAKPSGHPST